MEVLSEEEIEFNKEYDIYVKESGTDCRNDKPRLPSGIGVVPTTFSDLFVYANIAEEEKHISFEWNEGNHLFNAESMLASVSLNTTEHLQHRVLVDIWLSDGTDEEILASMKRLLPKWREKLNQPEPETTSNRRIGVKSIQKLIINRVLPILDLLFWSMVFKKEITNAQLSHLVFPDDPKDSQAIKETIKPFALEAMTEPYTRALRLFIDKDGEVGSASTSDVLSRDS